MSAWAVAGQSLSLIVGGAGLGLGIAFAGILYVERDRAGALQDALIAERLARVNEAARLATCEAAGGALREGREIDNAIPNDLGGFVLPDAYLVRPERRP